MQLTQNQQAHFDLVRQGVATTDAYLHELTDYHGGPLKTEYVLTTDIARALLAGQQKVGTEFLANKVKDHLYYRAKQASFTLGSRRFDVVALDPVGLPQLAVEIKIGVDSLKKLEGDLRKIIDFLESARAGFATRFLGLVVFQVHRGTRKHGELARISKGVARLEKGLKQQLATFAKGWSAYELAMMSFQGPNERIYDDEVEVEEDGLKTLGRTCHATRYHAIVIRKTVTTAELEFDRTTPEYLAKRFGAGKGETSS